MPKVGHAIDLGVAAIPVATTKSEDRRWTSLASIQARPGKTEYRVTDPGGKSFLPCNAFGVKVTQSSDSLLQCGRRKCQLGRLRQTTSPSRISSTRGRTQQRHMASGISTSSRTVGKGVLVQEARQGRYHFTIQRHSAIVCIICPNARAVPTSGGGRRQRKDSLWVATVSHAESRESG